MIDFIKGAVAIKNLLFIRATMMYLVFFVIFLNLVVGSKYTELSEDDLLKIHCSTDPSTDALYTWYGSIFAYLPQKVPRHVFNFIGFNIAHCELINGTYYQLSREVSYYLDPLTDRKLDTWKNPYTGEEVNVVHVANDPVNGVSSTAQPSSFTESMATIVSDVALYYPNPLYGNESYSDYGGDKEYYEGGEFFKWYYPMESLEKTDTSLEDISTSWSRMGPFIPFMKMGNIEGMVQYSCNGQRVKNFESSNLPQWLLKDIDERLPLYKHSPTAYETPNESSLTYFRDNFDAYLAGEQFPLPAEDDGH